MNYKENFIRNCERAIEELEDMYDKGIITMEERDIKIRDLEYDLAEYERELQNDRRNWNGRRVFV